MMAYPLSINDRNDTQKYIYAKKIFFFTAITPC